MESSKQNFRENGTAVFSDLKFSSGNLRSFYSLIVQALFHTWSDWNFGWPFKSFKMDNTYPRPSKARQRSLSFRWLTLGHNGRMLLEAGLKKIALEVLIMNDLHWIADAPQITIARLWNYFQYHYLTFTKQSYIAPKRPLSQRDFEYMLNAKFEEVHLHDH